MYEWNLSSGSIDPEIIMTPTATSEDIVSTLEQAQHGSGDPLLEFMGCDTKLHIRNAAFDAVDCCTCKTAAVFDRYVLWTSAWSETATRSDYRASNSPKMAVGLWDGTVHFMELCNNNNYGNRRRS
jgi:hypothetical protein